MLVGRFILDPGKSRRSGVPGTHRKQGIKVSKHAQAVVRLQKMRNWPDSDHIIYPFIAPGDKAFLQPDWHLLWQTLSIHSTTPRARQGLERRFVSSKRLDAEEVRTCSFLLLATTQRSDPGIVAKANDAPIPPGPRRDRTIDSLRPS